MTINRGDFDKIQRISAIDAHQRFDEHQGDKKRRRVIYQGRVWEEEDDDLSLQPQVQVNDRKKNLIHADPKVLQKTENLYKNYTTLEDKIAGIFFYETEAYYDSQVQKNIEGMIQDYKIGGFLFTKGEYKRQLYLIERYQSLAQISLLMGNDFGHSLSYYFQKDALERWGKEMMDVKYFSDLGKAVVFQNRSLGVHFQLAEKRGNESFLPFLISEPFLKAFKKGIRDAQGLISFFGTNDKKYSTFSIKTSDSERSCTSPLFSSGEVREVFSLKTLTFFDFTKMSFEESIANLVPSFKNFSCDAFLFSYAQKDIINAVCKYIKDGEIKEKDVEKRLMKLLALRIQGNSLKEFQD